jgi:hypothetical protein
MAEDMFAAGAIRYLLKDTGKIHIMEAIHAAIVKLAWLLMPLITVFTGSRKL